MLMASVIWISLLALLILPRAHSTPTQHQRFSKRNNAIFTFKETKAFAPATELKTSNMIVNLRQIKGATSRSSQALMSIRESEPTALNPVNSGASYGIDVDLGDETYTLIFDTGSSDLWVAETGVKCVNAEGLHVPVAQCAFGPLYSGSFSGGEIPGQNFYIHYGDGESLTGTLGYEDVTVSGVVVNHQEIASVDEGYWEGDGVTSGIIGFAYSSLTSAYPGTDPTEDDPQTNNIHYVNFIDNVIGQGKIEPMFSHVLERGPDGGTGQLALGGLPTIDFDHDFTSVPLQIMVLGPSHPLEATNLTYYTIDLDGVVVDGVVERTDFPVIIDSGTTLALLPSSLARSINKAFTPPSKLIDGFWENDCDATPPTFSFCIGGTDFDISPSELLIPKPLGYDPINDKCICGIQASSQVYVLGDTFLKNVVAVYDIGASEMRFAPHVDY